nr:hypothetical protein [Tanacetum cinerariifolium]
MKRGFSGEHTPLFPSMLAIQAEEGEDEAASTSVHVRHRGDFTTVTSLYAGQGSGNIDKTSYIPHDLPLPRVNTLRSNEGRMQHNELMDLVTTLSDRVLAFKADLKKT